MRISLCVWGGVEFQLLKRLTHILMTFDMNIIPLKVIPTSSLSLPTIISNTLRRTRELGNDTEAREIVCNNISSENTKHCRGKVKGKVVPVLN
jgi:hypothetical protein